jgi:L-ascorbate metabolism protein UlaG (beta-lactamase superfamily)
MGELKSIPLCEESFTLQDHSLTAWLGMAGVLVNARGTILMVDPLLVMHEKDGKLLSEVGYTFKLPPPVLAEHVSACHLVMYTHADDDHFGEETALALAQGTGCQFLAPLPVAQRLLELGIPSGLVHTAVEGMDYNVGAAQVTVTPAQHDWQKVNPWTRQDCCGYRMRMPDGVVWHPGDTRLIPELLGVQGVDVLYFDVAAVESHLGPEGSARLAESSGAKVVIPYHYGTFDLPPGSFGNCDPAEARQSVAGLAVRWAQLDIGDLFTML